MKNSWGNQRKKTISFIVPGSKFFWSASRFCVKTYFIQHISQWYFSYFERLLTSYDDDNTFYKVYDKVDAVDKTLRMSAKKLCKWFKDNFEMQHR